jgi:serine protease AprX
VQRVRELGGTVGRRLPVIDGFTAIVPAVALPQLAAVPSVAEITRNGPIRLMSTTPTTTASTSANSLYQVAQAIGATGMWNAGYTGKGVDVALIDSGSPRSRG